MTGSSLFVIGGARSGKSRYAQARAEAMIGRYIFIATAQPYDEEMRERIARHQADRDHRWQTAEAPMELAVTIDSLAAADAILLIDCLTLWTSNLLLAQADIELATQQLCRAIKEFPGHIILVANEVGQGIVPDNALARQFRDEAGRVNQAVAATATEVQMIVAGLALRLK